MRLLFVHAHFDDFELTAAGTFLLWPGGETVRKRVLICTDGASGHHRLSREETHRIRLQEQEASAQIGGYELEVLRLPDGRIPREACWDQEPMFLPALWKAIREFEPDYLFCPPLPNDPLAGIHIDHLAVAQAIRKVAYLINVPHVYAPEYPEESGPGVPKKTPVILSVLDSYCVSSEGYELVVDIGPVFDRIVEMSWCHQSQIREWLPWVGRHQITAPANLDEWREQLRKRYQRRARNLGLQEDLLVEAFTLTAWGEVPTIEQLYRDFPNLVTTPEQLARLETRITRWHQKEG